MLKTFPIEFVRQILTQTLYEQHLSNPNYFGGDNQIALSSFYEQLKNQQEVDRFVECFRDLTEQQNRTGLIGNGIILSPENPTITNLYSCLIVPMSWTCSMRCTLENRDQMLETINNLIGELKGRKVDVAQLNSVDENGNRFAQPFCVGTIGENDGEPKIKNGDYFDVDNPELLITKITSLLDEDVGMEDDFNYAYINMGLKLAVASVTKGATDIDLIDSLETPYIEGGNHILIQVELDNVYKTYQLGLATAYLTIYGTGENDVVSFEITTNEWQRVWEENGKTNVLIDFKLDKNISEYVENYDDFALEDLYLFKSSFSATYIVDDGTHPNIVFPKEHLTYEKFKVSLSFDSLRCDTPTTLNATEYCEISFGGSATLVSSSVRLGNDLIKIGVSKYGVKAETPIVYNQPSINWLEPLEMPSGSNANTKINQLVSNRFLNNTHTDALSLTLQYTFVCDMENDLIKQWFNYARYGTQYINSSSAVQTMTPNLIYNVIEYWSSWGNFEQKQIKTKIAESIDIENTEGDTLTISLTMQIQGEND